MNKEDLEAFLDPESFVPFVITTVDGFSVPVENRTRIVIGTSLAVVAITGGHLIHIPWRRIAHITHKGELG